MKSQSSEQKSTFNQVQSDKYEVQNNLQDGDYEIYECDEGLQKNNTNLSNNVIQSQKIRNNHQNEPNNVYTDDIDNLYLIDTHTHFFVDRYSSLEEFESQRKKMADLNGAIFISIACTPPYYDQAIQEAMKYDFKISVGIHPFFVANTYLEQSDNFEQNISKHLLTMKEFLQRHQDKIGKVIVAIGECGIGSPQGTSKDDIPTIVQLQMQCMKNQMDIALQYNLPVIIHAHKKPELQCVIDILSTYQDLQKLKINIHGFSGSPKQLKDLKEVTADVFISFNKYTFSSKSTVKKALNVMGKSHILIETDSPGINYGKNTKSGPYDVKQVFKMLQELSGFQIDQLQQTLNSNALTFYNLNLIGDYIQ